MTTSPITFVRQSLDELKKVTWPTRAEIIRLTISVIIISLIVGLFLGAGYVAGIRIGLTGTALEFATRLVQSLIQSMAYVLAVNGILLLTIRFLVILTGKMTKQKLVKFTR